MIKSMTAQELKEKLDSGKDLLLVDCREQSEWDAGHIPQAQFLPLSELRERYENELEDKDATIIMQCRSGKRSMDACMFLMSEGYTDLTNLEGGILDWQDQGYPIIK